MAPLSYSRDRIINRFNSMRTLSYRNIGYIRLKKKFRKRDENKQ